MMESERSKRNTLSNSSSDTTRANTTNERECRRQRSSVSANEREDRTKRGMSELITFTERERAEGHREATFLNAVSVHVPATTGTDADSGRCGDANGQAPTVVVDVELAAEQGGAGPDILAATTVSIE